MKEKRNIRLKIKDIIIVPLTATGLKGE